MSASLLVFTHAAGGEPRLEVKAAVNPASQGQNQEKGASVFFNSVWCDERSMSASHTPSPQPSPLSRAAVIQLYGVTLETGANHPSHSQPFNPPPSALLAPHSSHDICLPRPLHLSPSLHCNSRFSSLLTFPAPSSPSFCLSCRRTFVFLGE